LERILSGDRFIGHVLLWKYNKLMINSTFASIKRQREVSLLVLAVLGFMLLFIIWQNINKQLYHNEQNRVERVARLIQFRLSEAMHIPINALGSLQAFMLAGDTLPDVDHFDRFASEIIGRSPMVQGFAFVSPEGVVNHFYPRGGNESALGENLFEGPESSYVMRAINGRQLTLTYPARTVQGLRAVIARAPLFDGEQLLGLVQAVIDVDILLDNAVQDLDNGIYIYLEDTRGKHFWGLSSFPADATQINIAVNDGYWRGRVWTERYSKSDQPTFKIWFWLFGCLLLSSLLFTVNRYFTEKTRLITAVVHKTMELAASNRHLQNIEARWRSLLEQIRLVAIGLDRDGRVDYVNPFFCEITGYTREEVLGKDWISTFVPPAMAAEVSAVFSHANQGRFVIQFENPIITKAGDERIIVWFNAWLHGRDGAFDGSLSIGEDVTAAHEAKQYLNRLAYHDILTGLPNRALFNDRLSRAMSRAEREKGLMALLMLDLDHFKDVNDSLGHSVGDKLLINAARRLETVLREIDTVARLGGDEFTVILENIKHVKDVEIVAGKILDILSEPFEIDQNRLHISSSIGVVLYPFDFDDSMDLLQAADTALYHAKAAGRNGFRFYATTMAVKVRDQLILANSLHTALEMGEFSLAFQPIVNLEKLYPVAMEALLRWRHPQLGDINPAEFIPPAESNGLIIPMGYWVLREACRIFVEQFNGNPGDYLLTVNLSARQFRDEEFVPTTDRILKEVGMPPHNLVLEITESQLMEDNKCSLKAMDALKALGCRLAIDDFGTGYSSLSYLRLFPIDILKIDRSFIADAQSGSTTAALLHAILTMATSMGIDVIVEGVERVEQADLLRELEFTQAQGFYFGKPAILNSPSDERHLAGMRPS